MKRATVGMSGFITKVLGAIAPLRGMLSAIAIPLAIAALCPPLQAQVPPITQEPGTNTNVNPDAGEPNQFNITGGQLSGDNQNLFHSFQQFGLNQNQIANFLANPNIRNILGRVVSGQPSLINGEIRVTVEGGSGTPNLYLMNPAGIIFGANASLNVPASFTATTATSIGFGNNWFNAGGVNDYSVLVGSPSGFAFNVNQPGAIINAGNLSVNGGDLTLLGGTVVNTGNVSAPGRQITVAAVEGGRLVQIKQQGMLLSLEVEPLASADTQPGNWTLPVQSLPELLTGDSGGNATGLAVNSNGEVELTGSGFLVENGDVVAETVISSGAINLSSAGNIRAKQIQGNDAIVLTATAGGITIGNTNDYNSYDGIRSNSVTLSARDSINVVGFISSNDRKDSAGNLLSPGTTTLSSTSGDIIVGTVGSGSGGIDITAAGIFQARGSFTMNNLFYLVKPGDNPELQSFLEAKQIPFNSDTEVGIKYSSDNAPPISVVASPSNQLPNGSINAPITIRYGGATRTLVDETFPIVGPINTTIGRIIIQGGDGAFVSGPTVTGSLDTSTDDPFVAMSNGSFVPVTSSTFTLNHGIGDDLGSSTLYRNETYTNVFPPNGATADISSTAGAIIVGLGSNIGLYGSTQNLAFDPVPVPTNPTTPTNPINPITPTNPVIVTDPITPTNPVIVSDPATPTHPVIATNSSTSNTSNSTTTQTDTPPTELEKKTKSDASTTSSSVIGYTGNILDVSLESVATSCHATELRVRSDGKIELVGSCPLIENEEPKKLSEVNLFDEGFMNVLFPEIQLKPMQFMGKNPEKLPTIRSQSF